MVTSIETPPLYKDHFGNSLMKSYTLVHLSDK